MDYLKRAEEVRTFNNQQLKATVENVTLGGVTPNELLVLAARMPNLMAQATQIILLDYYIANLREDPPVDRDAAHDHLFYAMDRVGYEIAPRQILTAQLRYQLFNEDYRPPVSMDQLETARDNLINTIEEAAQVKEDIKAATQNVVILIEGYDRDEPIRLLHNGKQIAYATYDEHASAGIEQVRDTAEALAKSLGVELHQLNTATEEYEADCKALGLDPEEYR